MMAMRMRLLNDLFMGSAFAWHRCLQAYFNPARARILALRGSDPLGNEALTVCDLSRKSRLIVAENCWSSADSISDVALSI